MKNNNQQPEQEFILYKSYHGYPSKNKVLFTGTEEKCKDELQSWYSVTKRNGGDVQSKSDTHYTCENYDSNHATVTFEVKEA